MTSLTALVIVVGWLAAGAVALMLPFMAWSVTRNVRQIRVQLERLNENLESRGRSSGAGVLGL